MSAETLALIYLSTAKFITYLGLFGLTGATVARLFVVGQALRRRDLEQPEEAALCRRARQVAVASTSLLATAVLARVYAQTYSAFGVDEGVTFELLRVVAFESRWGSRWLLQLWATVLAVAAAVLLVRSPKPGWWLIAIGVGSVAATLPATGHAMAHQVGMLLQVGHILAGGLWLGTLAVLVFAVVSSGQSARGANGGMTATLINAFSPLAVGAVITVVLTGVATAVVYLERWSDLWETGYGQVLVGKIMLMLATGTVGAYNWRFLRPRLGTPEAAGLLVRSSIVELTLACVVLIVTAVLVHLPMPRE